MCTDFTLVELLVVIAVIAILAALLLPALNMARDKAKAIKCLSNLKQCGTAWISYGDDFNGFMPKNDLDGVVNSNYNSWDAWIGQWRNTAKTTPGLNYITNVDVMRCPAHIFAPRPGYAPGRVYGSVQTTDANQQRPEHWFKFRRWGATERFLWPSSPSSNYALYDSVATGGGGYADQTSGQSGDLSLRSIHLRHGKLANVWLLDGSARQLSRGELIAWQDGVPLSKQVYGGSRAGEYPDNLVVGILP